MKKIISVLLFISLAVSSMHAQRLNVDSLINLLETESLPPYEKMIICEELCNAMYSNDIDKALFYADKGLSIAKREKNKEQIGIFKEWHGTIYDTLGKDSLALDSYREALAISVENNDKTSELAAYISLGSYYGNRSENEAALDNLFKAISIAEQLGNQKEQLVKILGNIGNIYYSITSLDKAKEYFHRAEQIAENINDNFGKIKTYYGLCMTYAGGDEYDTALQYGIKSLELSKNHNNKLYEAATLNMLTKLYYLKEPKDLKKAEECGIEALRIAEEMKSKRFISGMLVNLSNVYREQEQYQKSIDAALKALEVDSTNLDMGLNIFLNLATNNIFLGNKEDAYQYTLKYIKKKDEQNSENLRREISMQEVKYETEKKELRITSLEQEKQLYTWLGILGVVAVILGSGLFFYRNRLNKQKIKQLEQEKQLVATQALLDGETAERSRLARDLHDGLGGLLSVLKLNLNEIDKTSLTKEDEEYYEKVSDILEESNKELRRIAHHMMPASLMKTGLKTSLSDFCQAIPGVTFQYQGKDRRLDERLEVSLYRCTYELINNAVKYADATKIDVQLLVDDNLISLSVYDNGIGFDPTSVTTGSGLENIRTRIATFSGKMYISSSENGTEITIEIERP
ncbi:sensor histidine kinase [Dysgonomonas sp. Marseille-P4677]|uniref:tetratricopeptide repeat-containing sensor histidine kinase n=1 Tax=Dysgonomonas sp. Marseille-P4677 TaxID=2364790 RepID=UPI00191452EE|nr:ATP-binding protein [Dysgonomonas sp. Marseille-P4677]MBK5722097.1 sensor histidine kinase [Dysgonomonas sp. Marseille-P4677]